MQEFRRVYKRYAYKRLLKDGECSPVVGRWKLTGILIHFHKWALCTAKECIHPQYPQGYPQINRRKKQEIRGFHRSCPHYPQVIHKPYPPCGHLWICMWTSSCMWEHLFTMMTNAHKYTITRINGAKMLLNPAGNPPDCTSKTFSESNENVKSPKKLASRHEKRPCPLARPEDYFLLLPRMVASGLAACFMKAEGLMPTIFLNCLEK